MASLPIAYLTEASYRRTLVILAASAFLGLASNVIRIVVTVVLVSRLGPQVAEGTPHTALGVVILFCGFLLLYGFGRLVSGGQRERSQK